MRSPSGVNIRKWNSLLLSYLDVEKRDFSFNNIFEANERFNNWFPGYEINVYKNLIQRHLKINKHKNCILYLDSNYNKESYINEPSAPPLPGIPEPSAPSYDEPH